MLRRLIYVMCHTAIVSAGLAYAAVPSPYRAVTPGLWGLENPAPDVYTDAPEEIGRILALIGRAEDTTRAFFGDLEKAPVWVICTTESCQRDFGFSANGLAMGYHFILIGPNGLNEMILTHERVHIALHKYMGPADILAPKFPAWFDEGLAAHLSGDTRLRQPADPRDADWIRAARRFFDWTRIRDTADWRDRYGAAARLVVEIEQAVGRDGLRDLIVRVGEGADFETEYRAIVPR